MVYKKHLSLFLGLCVIFSCSHYAKALSDRTVFWGGAALLSAAIIGYILYQRTPKFVLKKGDTSYDDARGQRMFSSAEKYHDNYAELMKEIDAKYREYKNPLMGSYNNLDRIKIRLRTARKKYDTLKKMVSKGKISEKYMKKHNINIDEIKKRIKLIDTDLEHVISASCLIKKHPDYLKALEIEKQEQIIRNQHEMNDHLYWSHV
ncbi:hypothetical protein ACFLYA_00570 [Candidatus Dependentiae bacterium]